MFRGLTTSSLVRYSSYRSHDHYQRQRVLQKERAIVSRGTGHGRRGLVLRQELKEPSVATALAHSVTFLDTQYRKREGSSSLGRYLVA